MKKRHIASVLGALALALGSTATAVAGDPAIQTSDQSAGNAQVAGAASEATQIKPSNTNISVRVLSPGNDGPVSQSNSVSSEAKASNSNDTEQKADQDQSGSGGIQTSDQDAKNGQLAGALSSAKQVGASNTNIPVRVGSKGDSGPVYQSNDVSSEAKASNDNDTEQKADQEQSGGASCGCDHDPSGVQSSDQDAGSGQAGLALSAAEQEKPANASAPASVESRGDAGRTSQSNSADSEAKAENDNDTDQKSDQSQDGSGSGIQTSDQSAKNEQFAAAASTAEQEHPKNVNISVRVLSPGDNGSVSQSNSVSSEAKASNDNDTEQKVDQDQSGSSSSSRCGCKDDPVGIQTADQSAGSKQGAVAASGAFQKGAENTNISVRVLSKGDDGSVRQSNDVSSEAKASNDNDTEQKVDQDQSGSSSCGCKGDTGIQTSDQSSWSHQGAGALSIAKQKDATNENTPVRVGSRGDDGRVSQSNDVSSEAKASNDNDTKQKVDQEQSGGSGSLSVQVAEQKAKNDQLAGALSFADQEGASNSNSPVRVWSKGDGGSVHQSNSADSDARASNDNETKQKADQDAGGGAVPMSKNHECGCDDGIGIQVVGQKSENEQAAFAASEAVQDFGESKCGCHSSGNSNGPIRVGSRGDDGSVHQSNSVDSEANADNDNETHQDAEQDQSGGSGIAIQALAQEAENGQLALAFSGAFQLHPSNSNSPTRVKSSGGSGSVKQSNDASSEADAKNDNETKQKADQSQRGSGDCGCKKHDDLQIQALGQSAKSWQAAFVVSKAFQLKPQNENKPTDVKSGDGHGKSKHAKERKSKRSDGGRTSQSNDDYSAGKAKNDSEAEQRARQYQA